MKPEEEPRSSDLEQYVKKGDVPTQSRNDLNLKYIANEKKIPGKLLLASQHQRKLYMRKKIVEKKGKHENMPKPGKHNAQSKGTSW